MTNPTTTLNNPLIDDADLGNKARFVKGTPFRQAGVGAVERTLQHKGLEFVSVKDFFAIGDGVTEDTAAVQAAADAVDGGQLFFPPGRYKIGSITIANPNTRLYGSGDASIIESDDVGQAIYVHGSSSIPLVGIRIDHLQLIGDPANTTAKGIFFDDVEDCVVESLTLSGFTNCGIYSTSGVSFARIRILNNTITGGDFGIAWQSGEDILVQGNICINQVFTNYAPHGIYAKGDSPRTRIIGNVVIGTSGGGDPYGIEVYGYPSTITGTIVANNSLYNCGGGIELSLTSGAVVSGNSIYTTTVHNGINLYDTNVNVSIVGNKMYDMHETGIALIPNGANGTIGVTISGNNVYGVGVNTIHIESADKVTVVGNSCDPYVMGTYTIMVRASTNVTINGNTVVCSNRGILADTSGGPLNIAHNIIMDGVGPADYPIYISGFTQFTIRDNEVTASGTIYPDAANRIFPGADSTTAVQFLKADRLTHLADWDTSNGRLTFHGQGTYAPIRVITSSSGYQAYEIYDPGYGAGSGSYIGFHTADKTDQVRLLETTRLAGSGSDFIIQVNPIDSGAPESRFAAIGPDLGLGALPAKGIKVIYDTNDYLYIFVDSGGGVQFRNYASGTAGGITFTQAGLVLGAPTGGHKGLGTINATEFYKNGVALGAGGDCSTNTATSVDGEVAVFSGTGGKTLKRATQSGVAKLTSGCLSAVANLSVDDGGTGASNAPDARDNLGAAMRASISGTTLTLAKITSGGTNGSITINNEGVITGYVAPT